MEFLVEFHMRIPEGTPPSDVEERGQAEAAAAAQLARDGHLLRLWRATDGNTVIGLYRAESEAQLGLLVDALPLRDWMDIEVRPLAPHPNDPGRA